jgi:hypothetical protein
MPQVEQHKHAMSMAMLARLQANLYIAAQSIPRPFLYTLWPSQIFPCRVYTVLARPSRHPRLGTISIGQPS